MNPAEDVNKETCFSKESKKVAQRLTGSLIFGLMVAHFQSSHTFTGPHQRSPAATTGGGQKTPMSKTLVLATIRGAMEEAFRTTMNSAKEQFICRNTTSIVYHILLFNCKDEYETG